MTGFSHPYYESVEDFGGVCSSSVHGDSREGQPFGDDPIEQDIASTSGYFHSTTNPCSDIPPPPNRSSDPLPGGGKPFGHQTSYYTSSAPSPEIHSSAGEHFPKQNGHYYDGMNRELETCQRKLKQCRRQLKECQQQKNAAKEIAEARGLRLFHSLQEARRYEDAEKVYGEILKGREPTGSEDEVDLDLKHSFAVMLIEQKRFQEAEPISREVWEKRKQHADPPSEASKESHRQLCSILCAVGRHSDAEDMHKEIYQRKLKDLWALENGDEVCQRLREQGKIKRAKEMQDEVWNERLKRNGPRDRFTVQSGLRLIGFLEELVDCIDKRGGTGAERSHNDSHKQSYKCEAEEVLQEIWEHRLQPEPNTDILDAGHRLGVALFNQNKFSDAEVIFKTVWEDKKQQLGDMEVGTIATGSMLGKALCRQDKEATYRRAANVLRGIWQIAAKKGHVETLSSAEHLAQAYRSLGEWQNAERIYGWILQHKERYGFPLEEVDDARWNLGQALFNQGKSRNCETEVILGDLYKQWKTRFPDSDKTLQCGHIVAQSLSTQDGKIDEALKFARDVFKTRDGLGKRGIAYLDGARLCGSLLLEKNNFLEAEEKLKIGWEHQAEGTEEQKMRLKCGHLYGQALLHRNRYSEAKRALEAVAEAQGAVSVEAQEITETRKLLDDVNRQKKEKEKEKRTSIRRKGKVYRRQ